MYFTSQIIERCFYLTHLPVYYMWLGCNRFGLKDNLDDKQFSESI